MAAIGVTFAGNQVSTAEVPTVAVTAPATTPAPELTPEDLNTWLDGLLPTALNSAEVPGAIVSVVKDGQVVTTRGYGYANVEDQTPVTGDSVFQVASLSKLPTTIAALQLVDQGKLDLDTDISTYVDVPIKRQFEDPITLRHLLTHTAGFEERRGPFFTYDEGATYDLAEDILTDPPVQVYRPGTTAGYSNYGLILVGYIVQVVSGIPFDQYVADNVLIPAGMTSSTYQQPLPTHLEDQLATGYVTTGERGRGFFTGVGPGGALSSTGNDMAAFMNAQLTGQLLSPTMKKLAWNPGIETPYQGKQLGLGYFLDKRNGLKTVGHNGDFEYFRSSIELFPEENIGIFVSVNGLGKDNAGMNIRRIVLQGFADRYLPAAQEQTTTDPAAAQRAQDVANRYIGSSAPESTLASLPLDLLPFLSPPLTATEDGGLILDGKVYLRQISPWVWEDLTETTTISADPTRQNPNLLMTGVITLIPIGAFESFTFYGLTAGLVLLLLVVLAWPLGAWRRYAPLNWMERIGRLGAFAVLAAVGLLAILFNDVYAISAGLCRTVQVTALLGALAIIPATITLVKAVRTRAGWQRILSNTILVMGLVLSAAVMASHHVFSWDISI